MNMVRSVPGISVLAPISVVCGCGLVVSSVAILYCTPDLVVLMRGMPKFY